MNEPAQNLEKYILAGRYLAWGLLITGLTIDLLCLKWPCLARALFHIEMLQLCILRMIPVADDASSFYFELLL